MLFSDWVGVGDFAFEKAKNFVKEGFVVLVVDVYGNGKVARDQVEAFELSSIYKNDRLLMRKRAIASLEEFKKIEIVDKKNISAVGYCFGGTVALELARSGANIRNVVTFHAGLDTPLEATPGNFRPKVLALHGADDPHVPIDQVLKFQEELRKVGADWVFVSYGNSVHSFTNKRVGTDLSKGVAYNKLSDKRSWSAAIGFLKENIK
ncbi:Dienelactone hydrolase [Thermodesulfobium acidiphilum]|uniref:Dienelactone hydrolase n=1 Tax=Thermodesulfobium acidiphilum TaxID=1794699 RepID=A0A2R4VZS9_THEAF|nr:Dienelactone hydrolase [Thermodesulfobium acidiphilum]